MNYETDTLSGWFILNSGFKVYGRCPACHSPRISYHKLRKPGLKGISMTSQGLIPVCIDCGKSLPTHPPKTVKPLPKKVNKRKSPY